MNTASERRALIYARVGTRGASPSIARQERACRRRAAELGASVAGVYADLGSSRSRPPSSQLEKLLRELQPSAGIDMVVTHSLDRLTRNIREFVRLRAELRAANVTLVSVTQQIEDQPTQELIQSVIDGLAEFYGQTKGDKPHEDSR